MKTTVKILGGGYSYTRNGRPAVAYHGELVSVDEAEAVRLSNLGIAALFEGRSTPSVQAPPTGGQAASVSPLPAGADTITSDVQSGADGGDSGQDRPNQSALEGIALPDSLGIVDGHFVREDLMAMERKEMEALAADLGVDVSKCRNKGEVADILTAVELDIAEVNGDDDAEAPPDLSSEGLVV